MWFRGLNIFMAIVLFCSLSNAIAVQLNCSGLNVADCKAKFGKEYDQGFKAIHLPAVKDLFGIYITTGREIQAQLPARDASTRELKEILDKLEVHLKVIKENENDNKKVAQTMSSAMKDVDTFTELEKHAKINELFEKHELKKRLSNRWSDMGVDIAKLYADMYAKLRARDRKAYSEYRELNTLIAPMKVKDSVWPSMYAYKDAREQLGSFFDAPYIRAINEAFQKS